LIGALQAHASEFPKLKGEKKTLKGGLVIQDVTTGGGKTAKAGRRVSEKNLP
jgi:FKBP-type peptidyl-prolyl cis-trans isomerase